MTNDEPIPPQARKAIRLAIATHLTQTLAAQPERWGDQEVMVDFAYSLADLLIGKSGL